MPADSIKDAIAASITDVTGEEPIQEHDAGGEPLADEDLPPIEDDDAGAEPAADEPAAEAVKEPAKAEPAVEERKPADKPAKTDDFEKEHGLKPKDKHGRENKIPHSIVRDRIVPNQVKKERAKWETEVLAPVQANNKVYEGRLKEIYKTELIMLGDTAKHIPPDEMRFLQMLASTQGNKYAELLAPVLGGGKTKAAAKGDDTTDADDPEPLPDVKEGDQVGYSPAQHAKLRAWDRRQAARDAETVLGKRFAPIEGAFQKHQQTAQNEQQMGQMLDQAWRWPGFAENNDAILKTFNADTTDRPISAVLQDAYRQVIYGKARAVPDEAALEAKFREKFMKELRGAPRSTSTGAGGGSAAERQVETDAETAKNPVRAAIIGSIRRT